MQCTFVFPSPFSRPVFGYISKRLVTERELTAVTSSPPSMASKPTPSPDLPHHFISRPVHDSLTRRTIKHVCALFLSILVAAGIILFVIWLALRPHRPRFHVSSFSATGLASPAAGLAFSFEIAVRNPNGNIAISYDYISASVFYQYERVASATAPAAGPFFQPPKNTTVVVGEAAGVVPVTVAGMIARQAAAGLVWFRLELRSAIRFRVSTWDTGRHHLHVSCDIEVGGADGLIMVGSKDKRCSIYF